MRRLTLDSPDRPVQTILCLGAHCDDIEIGCGGSLLRLVRDHPGLRVYWVVFSSEAVRAREARRSAEHFLKDAGSKEVVLRKFRNSFFPYEGGAIKEFFEGSLKGLSPDLVFTHARQDLHQDHRLVCELTWNTFRDHLILEYEVPKYDGDLGSPNVFVPLDASTARTKVRTILECFASQREKRWFTEETFLGLMRLRGVESNSPSGYAEGFYGRKLTL